MQESPQDTEVEEVLAAIRRLIVQGPPRNAPAAPAALVRLEPLVLTPALRVDEIAGPAKVRLLTREATASPADATPSLARTLRDEAPAREAVAEPPVPHVENPTADSDDVPPTEPPELRGLSSEPTTAEPAADLPDPPLAPSEGPTADADATRPPDPSDLPPEFPSADRHAASEPPPPPAETAATQLVAGPPEAPDSPETAATDEQPAAPEPAAVAEPLHTQTGDPALPFEDDPDSDFVFRAEPLSHLGTRPTARSPLPPPLPNIASPEHPGPVPAPAASERPSDGVGSDAAPIPTPATQGSEAPVASAGAAALTPLQPLDPNAPWIVDPFGLGVPLPPAALPTEGPGVAGAPTEPLPQSEAPLSLEPLAEVAAFPLGPTVEEMSPLAETPAEEPRSVLPQEEAAPPDASGPTADAEEPPAIPTGAIWPEPDMAVFPTHADLPALVEVPPSAAQAPEDPGPELSPDDTVAAPPAAQPVLVLREEAIPGEALVPLHPEPPALADLASVGPPPAPFVEEGPVEEGPVEPEPAPVTASAEPLPMTLVPPVEPLPPRPEPEAATLAQPEGPRAPWEDPAARPEPDWPELRALGAVPASPRPDGPSDPDAAVFAAVLAAAGPAPEELRPDPPPPEEVQEPAPAPPLDPELRALVADLVREEVRRELDGLREQVRRELMAELGMRP